MTSSLVRFWRGLTGPDASGRWIHPDDRAAFDAFPHSFDTAYPPGPYVGDIDNAPVVILGLNGRFSANTAAEFAGPGAAERYLARVHDPAGADWAAIARY